ncbi:MAG TPA: cupredoxin domain-containing protein [Ilumatobacteraceae bacterium]|nr:cupredoxin domain-containing protein [Ilumatobacteraceae bacterium]
MTASPRLIPRIPRGYAVFTAVALGVGAMSSCGGGSGADASDATVVEVELGRYTITPSLLTAPAGALELVVTNVDEGLIHNLVVAGKGTKSLAPGESQTLPMGEVAVGEYQMWCDVQGHRQMGQTGTMRIEPAPAAPAPTNPGT